MMSLRAIAGRLDVSFMTVYCHGSGDAEIRDPERNSTVFSPPDPNSEDV